MTSLYRTSPCLSVNLTALCANYRFLRDRHQGADCGAVVKANAYGLGVAQVAAALYDAGCGFFFVATLDEAIELRSTLPADAYIAVFHGPYPGEESEYLRLRLKPVLNTPEQIQHWQQAAGESEWRDSILHVDTGMNRLGLSLEQAKALAEDKQQILSAGITMVMSHLACANEPEHQLNAIQKEKFMQVRSLFPQLPGSFCNSAGILLDASYHHDIARPGCALYGINPVEDKNPMLPVVTLSAPILQKRTLTSRESVGYCATYTAEAGTPIATVQIGYADGYSRLLSNRATLYVGEHKTPLIGRVSMDMVIVDLSSVPEALRHSAAEVELLNHRYTVDNMANDAETIGYEVFTQLGNRILRRYIHE